MSERRRDNRQGRFHYNDYNHELNERWGDAGQDTNIPSRPYRSYHNEGTGWNRERGNYIPRSTSGESQMRENYFRHFNPQYSEDNRRRRSNLHDPRFEGDRYGKGNERPYDREAEHYNRMNDYRWHNRRQGREEDFSNFEGREKRSYAPSRRNRRPWE